MQIDRKTLATLSQFAGKLFTAQAPSETFRRLTQQTRSTIRVKINGRTIQYQAGLPFSPFSGITWFDEGGFIISDTAFSSDAELTKTILHELRRLSTSGLGSGSAVSGEMAKRETVDAYQFAERAYTQEFEK